MTTDKYKLAALNIDQLTTVLTDFAQAEQNMIIYPLQKTGSTFVIEYWKVPMSKHVFFNTDVPVPKHESLDTRCMEIDSSKNVIPASLIRHPFTLFKSHAMHGAFGVDNCTRGTNMTRQPELFLCEESHMRQFLKGPYGSLHTNTGHLPVRILFKTEFLTSITDNVMAQLKLKVLDKSESSKIMLQSHKSEGAQFFRQFGDAPTIAVNSFAQNKHPDMQPMSYDEFFFANGQKPHTERLFKNWQKWFDLFHYDIHGNSTSDAAAFLVHEV